MLAALTDDLSDLQPWRKKVEEEEQEDAKRRLVGSLKLPCSVETRKKGQD